MSRPTPDRAPERAPDRVVDTSGLRCPLPILRLRRGLESIAPGEVVELLSTDPGSVPDVRAFCRQTGDELVEEAAEGELFRFRVRRAPSAD